jgi:hypothetical protein
MAQDIIIRTLCDVCQDTSGDKVDGKPYTLGDGPAVFDIDLCGEHAAGLAALIEHARPQSRKRKRGAAAEPSPAASGLAGAYACDVPGCDRSFTSAQGIAMHRYRTHGIRSESPDATRQRNAREGSA